MSARDEDWLRKHKGEHVRTVGSVWYCDDDCGCSEAQVVAYYRNKTDRRFRVPVLEWRGTFRTENEPGAEEDLLAYRRALESSDPERAASIEWA